MSAPTGPMPIPGLVAAIAGHRSVTAVWVNELGGMTFAVGSDPAVEYVKVYPEDDAHLLADEVAPDRERIASYRARWNDGPVAPR